MSANTVTGGESDLPTKQRNDPELAPVIVYLETGILPADDKLAKTLALTQSQYVMQDGILYHVESDPSLRVIPPTETRRQLFDQTHAGSHLGDTKVHDELQRHYRWTKMRANITQWS